MPGRRPTSPMPTSMISRSPASGPSTASSRTSPTSSRRSRPVRPEHARDHLSLQRQDQEEGLLRLPAEAADHAHRVLDRHAGRRRLQGSDIPKTWKEYWAFWCDKVQPACGRRRASALIAIGQPMGVDSSDSFYSFLTFMDAYNVKLVDDDGKLLVDDPKVKQGLIGALERLHRSLHQGLHAAVLDQLEGPRQQRRLPQQDDRDDPQRDDLDRRQMARRREQRDARRRSSAPRRRRTTRS